MCDDAAAATSCHGLLLGHWSLLQRSIMDEHPLVKRAGVMAMWKLAEDETATLSLCKIPALFNDLTGALSDSNKETIQLAMLAIWQASRVPLAASILCRCRSLFPSIRSILKVLISFHLNRNTLLNVQIPRLKRLAGHPERCSIVNQVLSLVPNF
jgi:hypothetical protein